MLFDYLNANVSSADALAKLVRGSLEGEVVDVLAEGLDAASTTGADPSEVSRVALAVFRGLSRSDRFPLVRMMLSKRAKSSLARVFSAAAAHPPLASDAASARAAYGV